MKKTVTIIVFLKILIMTTITFGAGAQEVFIGERIDVGYFDVWRHADGKTWQNTDLKGGPDEPYEGTEPIPGDEYKRDYTFNAKPDPILEKEYDNIRVAADIDWFYSINETNYTKSGGGGKADNEGKYIPLDFTDFQQEVLLKTPYGYQLEGLKAKFYLHNKKYAENIKRQEQEKLVEGLRWYLPVHLKFYGVPKAKVQPPEPEKWPCQETSTLTRTWDALYEWDESVSSTCTDAEGNEYDCSYTVHHSEVVPYSETLKGTLAVNTKQGIPTDPKNPIPADRESRGSWEIIGYAQNKGLNPNEVTRAGYGFEVKVQTTYTTNWETKVPAGASPLGEVYKGPNKVEAFFYNTSGDYVGKGALEPTTGKVGDGNITWELPARKHVFPDGAHCWERKHYTDANCPDGKYTVKVVVSGAGKTDMCIIHSKEVIIYGDMYDDFYTRVATRDEFAN